MLPDAALALVEQLRRNLLSQPSATLALEQWCRTRCLAPHPPIRAVPRQHPPPPGAEAEAQLHLRADEPLRYRHVLMMCGARVLSEAENWYVPSRLTDRMNRVLESTDIPFGKVVQALAFTRQTLASTLLCTPPQALFRNRAILSAGGLPFAVLVETYRRELLERCSQEQRSALHPLKAQP